MISKEQYPVWFEERITYCQDDPTTTVRLLDFEHVIATTPQQVLRLHQGGRRRSQLWYLVQGDQGAYGVPTVLSSISSFRSLAHPVDHAVFVKSSDPNKTADAVWNLISDGAERSRLIRRGLKVAKMLSYTCIATRLEQALASRD